MGSTAHLSRRWVPHAELIASGWSERNPLPRRVPRGRPQPGVGAPTTPLRRRRALDLDLRHEAAGSGRWGLPSSRASGEAEGRDGDDEGEGADEVDRGADERDAVGVGVEDRKSTRLNSSHVEISYAVFCLKK